MEPSFHRAKLSRADLSGADLQKANFDQADLSEANLSSAVLVRATFTLANLRGVCLRKAALGLADLSTTNLSGVNLSCSDLHFTNLSGAILSEADLSGATIYGTIFGGVDLSEVIGLDSCIHVGPSVIDFRTLAKSRNLPLVFLRGCGLSDTLIDYLPALLNQPINFIRASSATRQGTRHLRTGSTPICKTRAYAAGLLRMMFRVGRNFTSRLMKRFESMTGCC
jgi:uncharacterized protein YjbI with pentapeptide repeats